VAKILSKKIYFELQIKQAYKEMKTLSICQVETLRTTKILLSILLVYMICNILQYFSVVVSYFGINMCIEFRVIGDSAITVNSAVNYLIYCTFGNGIRESFRKMFRMVTEDPSKHQVNRESRNVLSTFKFDL